MIWPGLAELLNPLFQEWNLGESILELSGQKSLFTPYESIQLSLSFLGGKLQRAS